MSDRRVWWFSFTILAALGVVWSLSIVPTGAPDEPAHAVKAAAITHGQFNSKITVRGPFDGVRIPLTRVRVPQGYARLNQFSQCWQTQSEIASWCVSNDQTEAVAATYVGAYQPLYYAIVGWPSHFLAPRNGVYGMRLVNAGICAALLASGFTSAVCADSRRLLIAGCGLAITPMVLFLAGSINPNAFEIAAAFCLWASLVVLVAQPRAITTRLVVRVTVAGVLLAASRSLSPAFVVIIVAIVLFMACDRATLSRLWAERRIRIATGVLIAGVAACAAFLVVNRTYEDRWRWPISNELSRFDVARESFEETGRHVEQAVGMFGWAGPRSIPLPRGVIDGWIAAVVALGVIALAVGRWRDRLVLAATAGGCLALPIVNEALMFPETFGWQGRYILPLAVGVPILSGWVVGRSERLAGAAERAMVIAVAIGASIAYVVAHQTLMTRNTVGPGNGLLDGLSAGEWYGPLTPLTLFAFAVLASIAYAVWLTVLASGRQCAPKRRSPPLRGDPATVTTVRHAAMSSTQIDSDTRD